MRVCPTPCSPLRSGSNSIGVRRFCTCNTPGLARRSPEVCDPRFVPLAVQVCFNPYNDASLGQYRNFTYDCIVTLGEAINASNSGGSTMVAPGVDINSTDASGIPAALAAVEWADVVVLAIGLDTITIEHETHDRTTLGLPGLQVRGPATVAWQSVHAPTCACMCCAVHTHTPCCAPPPLNNKATHMQYTHVLLERTYNTHRVQHLLPFAAPGVLRAQDPCLWQALRCGALQRWSPVH